MRRLPIVFILMLTLVAAGCDTNDDDVTSAAAQAGDILITDTWARPTPGVGGTTAFYMTISNEGAAVDTLVAAESAGCGVAEIHMSTIENDVMKMSPVADGITVPPKASVILGPGGLHVMCIDVAENLASGDVVDVTLEFATAGSIVIAVPVREDQ